MLDKTFPEVKSDYIYVLVIATFKVSNFMIKGMTFEPILEGIFIFKKRKSYCPLKVSSVKS